MIVLHRNLNLFIMSYLYLMIRLGGGIDSIHPLSKEKPIETCLTCLDMCFSIRHICILGNISSSAPCSAVLGLILTLVPLFCHRSLSDTSLVTALLTSCVIFRAGQIVLCYSPAGSALQHVRNLLNLLYSQSIHPWDIRHRRLFPTPCFTLHQLSSSRPLFSPTISVMNIY